MSNSKQCCTCGINKPLEDFAKNAKGKFGVHSRCKNCKKSYTAEHYAKNRSKKLAQNKAWKESNKEAYYAWTLMYYEKTKKVQSVKSRNRYLLNSENIKKTQKEYYHNNKAKVYAKSTLRRERIKCQAALCRGELRQKIIEFYDLARRKTVETGVLHHVDHIVPLAGKNFSGLHVPWNLQVIPAHENLSKGNKLIYGENLAFFPFGGNTANKPQVEGAADGQ